MIQRRGYTLVETIFYLAVLAGMMVLVVNLLLVVSRSFLLFRVNREINQSASVALERLVRETRQANSVDLTFSAFDAHPGRLFLSGTDAGGAPLTLDFRVENNTLVLSENGGAALALTALPVNVDSLIFRRLPTSQAEAVKMELILSRRHGGLVRAENFYATAVLRGSY